MDTALARLLNSLELNPNPEDSMSRVDSMDACDPVQSDDEVPVSEGSCEPAPPVASSDDEGLGPDVDTLEDVSGKRKELASIRQERTRLRPELEKAKTAALWDLP